jgi:hypothetical protein
VVVTPVSEPAPEPNPRLVLLVTMPPLPLPTFEVMSADRAREVARLRDGLVHELAQVGELVLELAHLALRALTRLLSAVDGGTHDGDLLLRYGFRLVLHLGWRRRRRRLRLLLKHDAREARRHGLLGCLALGSGQQREEEPEHHEDDEQGAQDLLVALPLLVVGFPREGERAVERREYHCRFLRSYTGLNCPGASGFSFWSTAREMRP